MEIHRALMQPRVRIGWSDCAGADSRARSGSDSAGPQFGIGNVARDRPAIGAVALALSCTSCITLWKARAFFLVDPVFDLDHQRSTCARSATAAPRDRPAPPRLHCGRRPAACPATGPARRGEAYGGCNQQRVSTAGRIGQASSPAPIAITRQWRLECRSDRPADPARCRSCTPMLGLWLGMPPVGARNEDAEVLADPRCGCC